MPDYLSFEFGILAPETFMICYLCCLTALIATGPGGRHVFGRGGWIARILLVLPAIYIVVVLVFVADSADTESPEFKQRRLAWAFLKSPANSWIVLCWASAMLGWLLNYVKVRHPGNDAKAERKPHR